MNVNTGEIKELHELSQAEKDSDFWQRIPSHLNKKASKVKALGGMVDIKGNSKLAKLAKDRREKPKGIISKKRFRDLKKITKGN